MIATGDIFQVCYNELSEKINKLRSFISVIPALSGSLPKISSITNPLTETEACDNWAIQIISGTVTALKNADNSYTFSTTAKEDVEFTFKIVAEGMESKEYSALLVVAAAPEITTSSIPDGAEEEEYSVTFAASGSKPVSWYRVDGNLPAGLAFNSETGVLSGVPTAAGTFTFSIKAVNEYGEDTKTFTLTIKEKEKDPEDPPGDGNFLAGTWWSEDMYKTFSGQASYLTDECGNRETITSLAQMQAFYTNNMGVVTFTADGKMQYKLCGVSYEATYYFDLQYDRVYIMWPNQHKCYRDVSQNWISNYLRLDFQNAYPLRFNCGGNSGYKKVSGEPTQPFCSVSPTTPQTIDETAGKISFKVTSNTYWYAAIIEGDIRFDGGENEIGINNGMATLTYKANDRTSERNCLIGIIYIGDQQGLSRIEIPVTQKAAKQPVISPATLNFSSTGEQKQFTVTSNFDWSFPVIPSWIKLSPSSASNDGSTYVATPVTITVENNTSTSLNPRTTDLYIFSNIISDTRDDPFIKITQDPAQVTPPPVTKTLSVSTSSLNFAASGGQNPVTITSNVNWTVGSDAAWATVSPASGVVNRNSYSTVAVTAAPYTGTERRSAKITVSSPDGVVSGHVIEIVQYN